MTIKSDPKMMHGRKIIQAGAATAAGAALLGCTGQETSSPEQNPEKKVRNNPIGVSTYSFWQFNGLPEAMSIETCIDHAAAMGFDGIELLLVQMTSQENSYLQSIKKRAFHSGLELLAPDTFLLQAKTCQGDGKWYTLDAIPESLELFRQCFYYEI